MNNAFVLMEAKKFAERLRKEAGADPTEQVDLAFQLALGRKPATSEREQSVQLSARRHGSLADFCQAMHQPERVRVYPMSTAILSRREMLQATGGGIASLAFSRPGIGREH